MADEVSMDPFKSGHCEGYRYIRAYRVGSTKQIWCARPMRWALYEVQGGKARRMGTAQTEEAASAYLLTGASLGKLRGVS